MNFNDLLGGVGKDLMNAAGDALVGAAKEYLGNAIQDIFVKKQADTKRTLSNIQHMKVVSTPAVMRVMVMRRIMFSVWRLLGDTTKQRLGTQTSVAPRDDGPTTTAMGTIANGATTTTWNGRLRALLPTAALSAKSRSRMG